MTSSEGDARARAEEVVRRAERIRGYSPGWLSFMADVDPEFLAAYEALYETIASRDVHLPAKFKELVTIAVLAAQREDNGLRLHIRRAFRLGATKEEITETIETAHFHTGALTLLHGLEALIEVVREEGSS